MKHLVLLLLFLSTNIYAQHGERVKAFKRAHITDALDLTAAEAEKFWPVYNAHEDKMRELRKQKRSAMRELGVSGIDQLTDAQANTLIEKGLQQKEKELVYLKELMEKLKTVIPPQKIVRLHRAEEDFKRMLLERMKNKKGNRGRN